VRKGETMRHILARKWIWITAGFAAINIVGLLRIISLLERREEGLRIEQFEPEGVAYPGSAVWVRFDQPMARQGEVGAAVSEKLVRFTPPVAGRFSWEDTRTLCFQPEEKLKLATPYTVEISRDFTSLLGESLWADAIFHFQTPALRLERIAQTLVSRQRQVTLALRLNDKVAPDEVARHLALRTRKGKTVGYSLRSRAISREVRVQTRPLDEDWLVVELSKGLRGISGPLGIENDLTRTMKIESGLKVGGVEACACGPGNVYISVGCTQSVDPKTARRHIQIEPEVEYTVASRHYGLKLSGPFVPTKRYRVKLLKGLKGRNSTFLGRDVVRSVIIPDFPPSLRFMAQGIYLSAEGSLLLRLESVNVKEAELSIERVYENNIVHYMRDFSQYRPPSDLGHTVATREYTFDGKPNQPRVTNIDLRLLLGDDRHGAFHVTARDTRNRWRRARRLVLITDLGISTKRSPCGLLVWVNALSTVRPLANVSVSVFTKTNQKVLEGTTDGNGIVHFKGARWSGDREPFAVVARKGSDIALVELAETELDDSPYDTGGRPYLRRGYEAFLYTDRGIYRPGERAVVHAIVRGPGPEAPRGFPVQFRVTRPDGRRFKTFSAKLSQWGSAEIKAELPSYALTGRYAVELRLPRGKSAIGTASFQVEEFMPDRMKVEIGAEDRRYRADEELRFTVRATHLFGAPAAGRRVEARCTFLAATFTHPRWDGYRFCDSSKKFADVRLNLGEGVLDQKGEKLFTVKVPQRLTPPSALTAVLSASVKEVGGRAVTAVISREIDYYRRYVGVTRERKDHAEPQRPERFLCGVVAPNGTPVQTTELHVTVYKVLWNTVLKIDGGRYRYVSEREEQAVARLACPVVDGRGEVTFTPREVGQYAIRLQDTTSAASADLTFYCSGRGFVPWAMEEPDRVELVADKEAYTPGETARILIKSPFPGQMLFTVESDRIHRAQVFAMETNTRAIPVTIEPFYGPNVYCTATVIRSIKPEARWSSHRAFGAIPVMLDREPYRLRVEVGAPGEVRPGRPLRVRLRVCDRGGAGRRAEVTLAAVDEGICQLTRFATPDPWSFFYAKRGLAVTTHDVYSLLMPEIDRRKVGSDSAAGGGEGRGYDPRLLNPVNVERLKPVALWRSGVETGEDGRAEVVLQVPEFTGQLRLMAVAAAGCDYGTAERPTIVKQPLMIRASFPRFLSPGDEFTAPVTVFNNTGRRGAVALATEATGGLVFLSKAPLAVEVNHGGEETVLLSVRAASIPGPASLKVTAALGTEQATEQADISVRPPATLLSVSGSGTVNAGQAARFTVAGGWIPKTERYWLSFTSLPTLKLGSSLRYLIHYPYGCVEQATSSSLPLLYLSDVAEMVDPDTFGRDEVADFVQAGIDRLFSMQTYNGGFASWPGYTNVYSWGSAYATHFLVEAKKAGYDVPKDNLDAALDYLDRMLRSDDDSLNRAVKAYACFVLALAGRPNASWTYRLHEDRENLAAYSRFHVAAALALMRERELVRAFLDAEALPPVSAERDTGGVLHSSTREAAMLLSVYMDTRPTHRHVPVLVERLGAAMKEGRWATTQENGFALMALGKYFRYLKTQETAYQAEVLLGGERLASFTHRDKVLLKPKDIGGREIEVKLNGKGSLYYYWRAEGIPKSGEVVERDSRLKVRRRFLSRDGRELNPRQIPHGEIIVVEIKVKNDRAVKNLVISDLLPAGFEIENPRIASRDTLPWARKGSFEPERVEMRDDRLVLFADLHSADTHYYRYIVRAITRGRFRLPAISAFCMYHPGISSVHGAGWIEVADGQ